MQIFVTSPDPVESAAALDDKRVVKMVTESAQIMSAVMHLSGDDNAPYKLTHSNHPCVKWAAKSLDNFHWLLEHFIALNSEYTKRYNKVHKCDRYTDCFARYLSGQGYIFNKPVEFCNCTSYTDVENVFIAYQLLLNDKWDNDKRTPRWYGKEL